MLIFNELAAAIMLFFWVVFVTVFLTKKLYYLMKKKGIEHYVAVYYNRKVIHVFAGGICAYLVPIFFSSYIYPFTISLFLAFFTYIPHKFGRLLYWFQTEDNLYEVSFAFMWGV
jgi:hypothetical protein